MVGISTICDALPGAITRAPMAAAERQLMAAPAALSQEQYHVLFANIKRLDENHRADDDDCAADDNRSPAGTEVGAFGDARRLARSLSGASRGQGAR